MSPFFSFVFQSYSIWLRLLDLSPTDSLQYFISWFSSALSISHHHKVVWFYPCKNLQLSFIQRNLLLLRLQRRLRAGLFLYFILTRKKKKEIGFWRMHLLEAPMPLLIGDAFDPFLLHDKSTTFFLHVHLWFLCSKRTSSLARQLCFLVSSICHKLLICR
jgi:hypothetical protein